MDDPRGKFLEAEELAHKLLDRLQSLEAEVQRHGAAADSLQEAREALVQAASAMGTAGYELRSLVTKLGEIGTTEIIERINTSSRGLAKGIVEATTSVHTAQSDASEQVKDLRVRLEKQATELGNAQTSLRSAMSNAADSVDRKLLISLVIGAINFVGLAVLAVLAVIILSRS